MEWFAMSSKFYLDLDDQGVTEGAQMLLMRICAYIADNETSGIISESALRKLGVRQATARRNELLEHGLITDKCATRDKLATNSRTNSRQTRTPKFEQLVTNSMYEVPAWFKWNEALERLVRKRKADRKRVAEKRQTDTNVARQSRESRTMSHDHIDSNNKERTSTYVEEASHVSNARAEMPRGPVVPADAWKLIRSVIPNDHPQAVKTDLAMRTSALLIAGTDTATIQAALELWLTKPNLGPGTLPSLVSQVIKSRAPLRAVPDTHLGPASGDAMGWLAIAEKYGTHTLDRKELP